MRKGKEKLDRMSRNSFKLTLALQNKKAERIAAEKRQKEELAAMEQQLNIRQVALNEMMTVFDAGRRERDQETERLKGTASMLQEELQLSA